jgi:protein O-GlcNAc transferase
LIDKPRCVPPRQAEAQKHRNWLSFHAERLIVADRERPRSRPATESAASQLGSHIAPDCRRQADKCGVRANRVVFAPARRRTKTAWHVTAWRISSSARCLIARTTASDALWTGVPFVICLASTVAGRVATSPLSTARLDELHTRSLADHEAPALQLAQDPGLLALIKAKLAGNRHRPPSFDTARFTRHFKAAEATMWQRHRQGVSPESFAVRAVV